MPKRMKKCYVRCFAVIGTKCMTPCHISMCMTFMQGHAKKNYIKIDQLKNKNEIKISK